MLNAVVLPKHWQKPVFGLVVVTVLCVAVFWETWHSIIAIWIRSETYAHGFIVVPVSLWLVWMRRKYYQYWQAKPSLLGLFFLCGCGFLWLTAHLVSVLVVQQLAVLGLLISAYWTIIGNKVILNTLFPLAFLFLMVPFGEDFVPTLMEYTATFIVTMLRLTGITVYREGLHFELATGSWSVVDACSGIRYLIASITLGSVYMYLNYTSYIKRLLFMLAAVLVPILANGLRGYMIVMLGHLSDMKLATGVDHLIYGWLFFGLVMLLLFYIGSFWQDPPQQLDPMPANAEIITRTPYRHYWSVLSGLLLGLSIWPLAANWMIDKQGAHVEIPAQFLRSPLEQWQTVQTQYWGWEPMFNGVAVDAKYFLSDGNYPVGVYLANFGDESQGELVNSQNYLVPQEHETWRIAETAKTPIQLQGGKSLAVDESVLDSAQQDLLVLRWYRIGEQSTVNNYYAKWLQLIKRLSGDASAELLIVLYTETPHGDYAAARARLQKVAALCCG